MRVLTAVFFAFTLSAVAAKSQAELAIVTESFPPFNYIQDGEPAGLSTEVVTQVLKTAGLDASIDFYPWARAYQVALNEPDTLIYSIARIPEREPLFEWIGVIAPYRTSFYKLKSAPDIQIASLEDAKQYQVGTSRADVIETYLVNQGFTNLQVSGQDRLNVLMLNFGRIQLMAYDEAAFPRLVEAEGLDIDDFERVFRIEGLSGQLYMAMQPDSDPNLIRALKDGLDTIKANGDYDAIHNRYFLY
ncbi:substrate-binding periplasmic protein [Saccharospirillum impatiens]|uniref:substrate-binding periplasmic protein n=1 Tax=Saccharospirillum impatiens TaxID=169438 RepID=UPI0003FE7C0E|nr:transporter substrate-binding domain-containing protein [Saccharospirillum impatiens]